MNKQVLRQALPILLAIGLLWYVLHGVPLDELAVQFRQAHYGWLMLVVGTTMLYFLIRAARWQLVLQVLGYQPSLVRTTIAILAGMLASLIIPGAGELTRCGTLLRTDGVPIAQGIGSVVAERVIDLFMLVLLIGLTILLEFDRMQLYLSKLTLVFPGRYVVAVIVVVLTLAGVTIWQVIHQPTLREHPIVSRIMSLLRGLKRGFLAIRELANPRLFITLTILLQIIAWLGVYASLRSLPDTSMLPPKTALTILTASSLGGLAVPTQGGIGTYHFFVSRVLALYGFSLAQGAVIATYLHAVGFSISLVLSSVSFLIVPILITNYRKKQETNLVK